MLKRVNAGVLSIAYEDSGPADGKTSGVAARLSLRRARIRRGDAASGLGGMSRRNAISARLRTHALPLGGHAALRAAGRAGARSAGLDGCAGRSSAPSSAVTTGAGAPPASSPHCGRSACAGWCQATATTSRTSRARANPRRRRTSSATGTSTISTASAAAPASSRTAVRCASCCGSCGRRIGTSTTRPYERTAASFDNPDFVPVVIHSYRHRYALVPGDPAVEETERRLATQPRISVPTVALDGGGDGVTPSGGSERRCTVLQRKVRAQSDSARGPQPPAGGAARVRGGGVVGGLSARAARFRCGLDPGLRQDDDPLFQTAIRRIVHLKPVDYHSVRRTLDNRASQTL